MLEAYFNTKFNVWRVFSFFLGIFWVPLRVWACLQQKLASSKSFHWNNFPTTLRLLLSNYKHDFAPVDNSSKDHLNPIDIKNYAKTMKNYQKFQNKRNITKQKKKHRNSL